MDRMKRLEITIYEIIQRMRVKSVMEFKEIENNCRQNGLYDSGARIQQQINTMSKIVDESYRSFYDEFNILKEQNNWCFYHAELKKMILLLQYGTQITVDSAFESIESKLECETNQKELTQNMINQNIVGQANHMLLKLKTTNIHPIKSRIKNGLIFLFNTILALLCALIPVLVTW